MIEQEELVDLITDIVKKLAEAKGYLSYPKRDDIKMVLYAIRIAKIGLRRVAENEKAGRAKPK